MTGRSLSKILLQQEKYKQKVEEKQAPFSMGTNSLEWLKSFLKTSLDFKVV